MDGILFAGPANTEPWASLADTEGYEVGVFEDLPLLGDFIVEERPRLVVLTTGDPAWLHTVRKVDGTVPVMVLPEPGQAGPAGDAALLSAGADAVVHVGEGDEMGRLFLAWLDALHRRMERCPMGQERYLFGDVEVDVFRRTVKKRSWRLLMSSTEFDLLVHLVRNSGRVVSREEILKEVWKYDTCPTTRTVDNFICKLRRKIEDQPSKPRFLKTIKGTGYRFDLKPSA